MNEAVPDLPGSAGLGGQSTDPGGSASNPGSSASNPGSSASNPGSGASNPGVSSTGADGGPAYGSSTRRRILDISLALMSQRGVDGTSMRDLASAAGLNVASLYHYFPSKRDLLEAVLVEHGFLPLAVTAPARSVSSARAPVAETAPAAADGTTGTGTPAVGAGAGAGAEAGAGAGGGSDLAGLIEGILNAMFQVEDFVRLMVGEAMRSEETARSVGLELFSTFEDSIEAWVRTHRPDLDERAGAGEVSRLISAMVIGIFIQHAAGALPNEGDDLAALIVARAVEAARVISPS
jgi:AcrR family transcriptional regulator